MANKQPMLHKYKGKLWQMQLLQLPQEQMHPVKRYVSIQYFCSITIIRFNFNE